MKGHLILLKKAHFEPFIKFIFDTALTNFVWIKLCLKKLIEREVCLFFQQKRFKRIFDAKALVTLAILRANFLMKRYCDYLTIFSNGFQLAMVSFWKMDYKVFFNCLIKTHDLIFSNCILLYICIILLHT